MLGEGGRRRCNGTGNGNMNISSGRPPDLSNDCGVCEEYSSMEANAPSESAVNEEAETSPSPCAPQQQAVAVNTSPSSIFPKDISDHYSRHGVEGVEEFIIGSSGIRAIAGGAEGDGGECNGYRFIRLNPRFSREETLSVLRRELASSQKGDACHENTSASGGSGNNNCPLPIAVHWLNDSLSFYAIPSSFVLSKSASFQMGRVYGMDISSGAAVAALLFDDHDIKNISQEANGEDGGVRGGDEEKNVRVLDLCCSPGLKLCAIADLLSPESTVVGVDISETRISLCKKIITKYHIKQQTSGNNDGDKERGGRIRLYCQDGCRFGLVRNDLNLVFDSEIARGDAHAVSGKRKRMNKSARAREKKRLRAVAHLDCASTPPRRAPEDADNGDISIHLFDRVLVDAECSTDGAVRHLKHKIKLRHDEKSGDDALGAALSKSGISKLGDAEALAELVGLQRRLILSGFRLLKRGGTLVYSTCSLCEEQNEGVVNWLLQKRPDARIIPVAFKMNGGHGEDKDNVLISEGSISGTVRFRPKLKSCPNGPESSTNTLLYGGGFWLAKIGKK